MKFQKESMNQKVEASVTYFTLQSGLLGFPGTGIVGTQTSHLAQAAGVKVIVTMEIKSWNFRQDCNIGHDFLMKWKTWRLGYVKGQC